MKDSRERTHLRDPVHTTSWQESLLVGLRVGDLINHDANTALGDDVGDAVANLNANDSMCGIDAEHGEQVHNREGAPTDHGPHLCGADLVGDDWVSLSSCGLCKTVEELVDNVQEEDHGQHPAAPTRSEVTGDDEFAIVARCNHEGRADTKVPGLLAEHFVVKLHHEKDLDQEQGHGQEPIHVTIGIVEWHAGQSGGLHRQGTILNCSCRVVVAINPRVEDTDVVVCSNEGHQAGNEDGALVLVCDSCGTEPEVHGRCHHACKSKREAIVNGLVL